MERKEEEIPLFENKEEELPDFFNCCICLDLLYKPVVLSCGHIACFWCIHNSMTSLEDSHCPICRNSYKHFPSICRMLHFMLLKLYPVASRRREEQMLAEEKEMNCFSPQFHGDVPGANVNIGCDHLPGCSSAAGGECQSSSDLHSICKGEARPSVLVNSSMLSSEHATHSNSSEDTHHGDKNLATQSANENGKQLSVADALCVACKQMLFRPVALNCGHAYCEACIPNQVNGILRCQVCQCFHPSGHPKVCLEFDHFLEVQFPKEYALRRDGALINRRDVKTESTGSLATINDGVQGVIQPAATQEHRQQQSDSGLFVHIGFGCDYCGVIPITGDRYKCKDCVEIKGFDLCGDCYNSRSNLPGRFNQQHTPEHRFELVEHNYPHAILQAALSRGVPANFSSFFGISSELELSESEFPLVGNGSENFTLEENDQGNEEDREGAT